MALGAGLGTVYLCSVLACYLNLQAFTVWSVLPLFCSPFLDGSASCPCCVWDDGQLPCEDGLSILCLSLRHMQAPWLNSFPRVPGYVGGGLAEVSWIVELCVGVVLVTRYLRF